MRDMIKPTLSLFVICFVTAFCLAFVNNMTKEPIIQRMEMDAEEKQETGSVHRRRALKSWKAGRQRMKAGIIRGGICRLYRRKSLRAMCFQCS